MMMMMMLMMMMMTMKKMMMMTCLCDRCSLRGRKELVGGGEQARTGTPPENISILQMLFV